MDNDRTDFLHAQARRMGTNLLLLAVGLLTLGAGLFAVTAPEVLTIREDPLPPVAALTAGPRHSLTRAGQLFTLKLPGNVVDSRVERIGGSSPTNFVFVPMGDRFLMVATETNVRPLSTIRGGLRPFSTRSLTAQAAEMAAKNEPQLAGRVLPVYFDTGASADLGGLEVLFIVASSLATVGLISALSGIASRRRMSASPVARKLRKVLKAASPTTGSVAVVPPWPKLTTVNGLRDVATSNDYIVIARLFRAVVVPSRDVIWFHGVQKKAYALMRLYVRSGKKIHKNYGLGPKSAERRASALRAVAAVAPHAFEGFDRTLAQRWKRRNRKDMVAAVDAIANPEIVSASTYEVLA
jgi:hypothetical protein